RCAIAIIRAISSARPSSSTATTPTSDRPISSPRKSFEPNATARPEATAPDTPGSSAAARASLATTTSAASPAASACSTAAPPTASFFARRAAITSPDTRRRAARPSAAWSAAASVVTGARKLRARPRGAALPRHAGAGWTQAPRPNAPPARSGRTCPSGARTKRTMRSGLSTPRHPAHVRTGRRRSGSRWVRLGFMVWANKVSSSLLACARLKRHARGGAAGHGLGRQGRAGRFDLVRLVLEEVDGTLLNLACLLDAKSGADRQPVRILAGKILDGAIARLLNQLQRPEPDAAHEPELVPIGQRGLAPRRLLHPLAPRLLHRGLGVALELLGALGRPDALDRHQLLDRRLGALLQRAEPEAVHGAGEVLVHRDDLAQRRERLLLHLLELGLADDVELPLGELRGQPHVLPLAADRQAQLLVRHHQLHPVIGLVDDHLVHLGRLNGVDDVAGRIAIVGHDVDLLAAQLLHHGLDARPFDADAGAHRIDVGVAAGDRDLAARARLASDADDLDDALVDLGHLRLEQLLHQVRI